MTSVSIHLGVLGMISHLGIMTGQW